MGLLAVFFATIFAASKDLTSKKLSFNVDGTVSAFASFLYGLPLYALFFIGMWVVEGPQSFAVTGSFFLFIILRSLTDVFGETLKMHAFAHGEMSIISSFLALSPVFLLFTSPFITGDPLTMREITGIPLIVLGGILLLYKPGRKHKDAPSPLPIKGILIALASALFFSLNTSLDRMATQQSSPVMAGFVMTLLAALYLLPFFLRTKGNMQTLKKQNKLFWARGIFETLFMVSKLTALMFLSAPAVAGLTRSALLLTVLGGKVLFKEEDLGRKFFASLVVFAGLVIIVTG